jgi:hypothetical protein
MKGLGIGQQLGWLTKEIAAAASTTLLGQPPGQAFGLA